MKKLSVAVLLTGVFVLSGCGQNPSPPVYGNSGTDVMINTTRYIQPVMQKGQTAETEATVLMNGAGSYSQLQNDVSQTQEVIDRAKSEISAMTYPTVMAPQKDQTITALTTLSVDLDKLLAAVKTGKGIQPAIETVMADLDAVQATVQIPQGK